MVKFILYRPIAVTMTLIALMVMGTVMVAYIPVSLVPDIQIPEITVQVSYPNASARELEQSVVSTLRRNLLSTSGLDNITTETRAENSLIKMRFAYGEDVDLAFIEVNEKIDQSMGSIFKIQRPKVIKASATDIPVFYLEVTQREEVASSDRDAKPSSNDDLPAVSQQFVELSNFVTQVISKRLEQLPEVAFVDISGRAYPEFLVIPNQKKLESLGLTSEDLATIIKANNVTLGELVIRDGQYQYNVRFDHSLSEISEIENIYLKVGTRLLQLKDVATTIEHPQPQKGLVLHQGKNALTLAIIKQNEARMSELKDEVYRLTESLRKDYPKLEFTITRDQTKLLDYSISNLTQGLIWGSILALISMAIFLKDVKSPLLIGLIMPLSLVVSLMLFYCFNITINIISLSGLVLGIGMMVDNSIIVIDNITQHREQGKTLDEASIVGSEEVAIPMLSSVFTTCAVFIPLIFIGGMAGALFYDEAMAVAIGAFVSLATSVTVIPVFYRLLHLKSTSIKEKNRISILSAIDYESLYKRGFRFTMRHQKYIWGFVVVLLLSGILTYQFIDKSQLPHLTKDEIMVSIDWNERINVDENRRRTYSEFELLSKYLTNYTALIGQQQFLLDERTATSSEALIYIKAVDANSLSRFQSDISKTLKEHYPLATLAFDDTENIFKLIFSSGEHPLTASLRTKEDLGPNYIRYLDQAVNDIKQAVPEMVNVSVPKQELIVLKTDPVRMITYQLSYDAVINALQNAFNQQQILLINRNNAFVPVIIGENVHTIQDVLNNVLVMNSEGTAYPIREFIIETQETDLKTILSGKNGEFFPVHINIDASRELSTINAINKALENNDNFEVNYSGSLISNKKLIGELSLILLVSLGLLYSILAAQFESLLLPLIILLEVPIDISAAVVCLYIFGDGINIMSLIGLVVMNGIIINDSILKIDTINQLRRQGYSILHAIAMGGQRRLKAILMTSFTTIVAMIPVLFLPGLGSELQRPMAIVLIGGMGIGTFVSLYFIPMCYYSLIKK